MRFFYKARPFYYQVFSDIVHQRSPISRSEQGLSELPPGGVAAGGGGGPALPRLQQDGPQDQGQGEHGVPPRHRQDQVHGGNPDIVSPSR